MVLLTFFKFCYGNITRRFFLILWISLVSYIFYDSFIYYKDGRQFYYLRQVLGIGLCISRGTAAVLNICCALVLLPLCKKLNHLLYRILNKLWPSLFFFWLERAKSFHMTVAITLFLFGFIHSISHLCNIWNFSRNFDEARPEINVASFKNENPFHLLMSQPGVTGVSMLAITLTMSLTSLRIVRRRIYNAFWYTHHLYLPFMLLLIIHPLSGVLKEEVLDRSELNTQTYSSQRAEWNNSVDNTPKFVAIKSKTWLWMAFPLGCFFVDLIWRIFARNRANVDILEVTSMSGRTLSLTISCPHEEFYCRSGQYILLQCANISLLEWHPFTVVKVPTPTDRKFVVWIKVRGDWTEALENLLIDNTFIKPRMLVDGPMASPMERVGRSRVALCVAAGVGVTPFVPILLHMLSEPRSNSPGRLHLIWIVRQECEAAALGLLISRCLQTLRAANRPDRLHFQLFVTDNSVRGDYAEQSIVNEKGATYLVNHKNEETETLLTPYLGKKVLKPEDNGQYSLAKEYPLVGCRTRRGRPHWDQEFGYWVHLYPGEDLPLYCCGPKKLVNTLKNKCKDISEAKFTVIHERFS